MDLRRGLEMRSALGSLVVVAVVASLGIGAGLSGGWSSGISFAEGIASFTSTINLHLSLSGWELKSTWDLAAPELNFHTLTFRGSLGLLDYEAGVSFRFTSPKLATRSGSGWALEGLEWTGGHLSLELPLGNLTLRLTLLTAPGDR